MRTHKLKTLPQYFFEIRSRAKKFEIRNDDRGFRAGDLLELREWNPALELYTGRSEFRTVDYILPDHPGLMPGYVIMSIS